MQRGTKLKLQRRAERMAETRRRIIEATVELHGAVGGQATISAIAARAGVQRLTVYRHFPDEVSLTRACTSHVWENDPLPDPTPWRSIADPEPRLRTALAELYGHYRRNEGIYTNFMRDLPLMPAPLLEVVQPFFERLSEMRTVLADCDPEQVERPPLLLAAVGHALDFQTWHSLIRGQNLEEAEAIEVMAAMVRCVPPLAGRHED